MDLAFLLALLTALGFGVYALRVTAERNRLKREIDIWRDSASGFMIVYGRDWAANRLNQVTEHTRRTRAAVEQLGGRKPPRSKRRK